MPVALLLGAFGEDLLVSLLDFLFTLLEHDPRQSSEVFKDLNALFEHYFDFLLKLFDRRVEV